MRGPGGPGGIVARGLLTAVLIAASVAAAQFGQPRGQGGQGGQGRRGGRGGGGRGQGPGGATNALGSAQPTWNRYATLDDFDGTFQFCRLQFRNGSNGDGNGWGVDWPRADQNLSIRLSELTRTPVSLNPDGDPNSLLLTATMPELSHCPLRDDDRAGRSLL